MQIEILILFSNECHPFLFHPLQHGPLAERAPNGSTPSQLSESCQLTLKVCPNAYRS